jgi:predicted DNA-binding transcriptional regulator YafY
MNTPDWAERQEQERAPLKASRLAALFWLRQQNMVPDASKTEIADALGVSRWTLDRDLAALDQVAADYERYRLALLRLPYKE